MLEKSKITLIKSLFTLMIFSNEYLLIPGVLLLFLIFVQVFHWILKDRLEHIYQSATNAKQYVYTRNTFILLSFLYLDFNLVYSCYEYSFQSHPDVYFAFGFEFALLFIDMLHQLGKLILNTWELRFLEANPDEEDLEVKTGYMKILNIVHTSLELAVRAFLLVTFFSPYRFPLYLIHDVLAGLISLLKQFAEMKRFRTASRELDSKLEDATEDDLNEDNNLCIICREDMTTQGVRKGERLYPKKLACGHIIHMGCLKGWFARSQVCPMCRAPVLVHPQQATTTAAAVPAAVPQQAPRAPEETEAPQQQNQNIQPATFLHQHLPHGENFFHSPLDHGPRTATGTSRESQNILRLRTRSLVPPDWTLLKLISPVTGTPEVRLNPTTTATITSIRQTPSIPQESEEGSSNRMNDQLQ